MTAPKVRIPALESIFTVDDIMRKTGLTQAGVSHRVKVRESKVGPYRRLRGVYVFTEQQFKELCESWGLGQNAVRLHASNRTTKSEKHSRPRRMKKSA